MTLHKKPPSKGAKKRYPHFPFRGTPRGYSWEAYIAGPCHWFDCHDMGRSKPCLHCITNGELRCERNHDIDEPTEIGYQPVWDKETGKPFCVIVYEYDRDHIDKLRLHHLVTLSRGKGKAEVLSIQYKGLNAPLYQTTREDFKRPADLTESLLRIWKMPELVAWVRMKQGQAIPVPTPAPVKLPNKTARMPDGKPYSPMMQAAALRYGEQGCEPAAVGVDTVVEAAKKREEEHRKKGHLSKPVE